MDIESLMGETRKLAALSNDAASYLLLNLTITAQCGNPVSLMFPGVYQCLQDARRAHDEGKIEVYTRFLRLARGNDIRHSPRRTSCTEESGGLLCQ